MEFDSVASVFQIEISSNRFTGQLTGLAQRDESESQLVRNRRTKDEPSCFDPDTEVDSTGLIGSVVSVVSMTVCDAIDGETQSFGIEKKCRDVAELDTGLWMVGNRANKRMERHGCDPRIPIMPEISVPKEAMTSFEPDGGSSACSS